MYKKIDSFIEYSKKVAEKHPFIVVYVMHEYFRNLYPSDPYINFDENNHKKRINETIDSCIKILDIFSKLKNYDINFLSNFSSEYDLDKKNGTQHLFGSLWAGRESSNLLNSYQTLLGYFERADFDPNELKNKKILDMGCGSGRFTIALSRLTDQIVTGIDLGDKGLDIGNRLAVEMNIKNIKFIKSDILQTNFDDEYFDFIFCKGVLHHTVNFESGVKELLRILKKGGKAYIYLYGSGGYFWYSRKKMREVFKFIPLEYTNTVLKLIGMPQQRTIFSDSWYVPIENHITEDVFEKILNNHDVESYKRITKSRGIELEQLALTGNDEYKELWGNGELRYIINK